MATREWSIFRNFSENFLFFVKNEWVDFKMSWHLKRMICFDIYILQRITIYKFRAKYSNTSFFLELDFIADLLPFRG